MKWKPTLLLGMAGLVAAIFTVRGQSALPADEARRKLQAGALLVDVRMPEEFAAKRIPGATNVPLDTLKAGIPRLAPDKSSVLLLHCRSGRRSAIAEKELRSLGYTNAFNIGSFEQAERIASARPTP